MGNTCRSPTPEQAEAMKASFEKDCEEAAKAIAGADYFLFATGAGFSADSGLAVYKDVADIAPYHKRGLNYSSICVPQWLEEEPELFFGFWGNCFNTYRGTTPHNGYKLICDWKNNYFSPNKEFQELFLAQGGDHVREQLIKYVEKNVTTATLEDGSLENIPGPFFHWTSNVDAHAMKSGMKRTEVHEVHGNTEVWQCGKPCSPKIWLAPSDYKFTVNQETMLTPKPESPVSLADLKNGFKTTFPQCKFCPSLARPSILMFQDDCWLEDQVPGEYSTVWESAVKKALRFNEDKKLVILEIGCGNRVTTIRRAVEYFPQSETADQVTVIRVNPEFPFPDQKDIDFKFISILSRGIEAVTTISKYLDQIKSAKGIQNLEAML